MTTSKTKTTKSKRSAKSTARRTTTKKVAKKAAKAPPKTATKAPPKTATKAPPTTAPSTTGKGAALPDAILAKADKLVRIDSLFIRESGTESYAIFGPRGPVLWEKYLTLSKDDLAFWRRALSDPKAHDGATWRHRNETEEYAYQLTLSSEVEGHLVALSEDEPQEDGEDSDVAGPLCFVGAKYGNLFMVFAGSPNDFADGDFQGIHDVLRASGVAG